MSTHYNKKATFQTQSDAKKLGAFKVLITLMIMKLCGVQWVSPSVHLPILSVCTVYAISVEMSKWCRSLTKFTLLKVNGEHCFGLSSVINEWNLVGYPGGFGDRDSHRKSWKTP